MFYFNGVQTLDTGSTPTASNTDNHHRRFTSARDARNRKVRGLWKHGDRYCAQVRVPGEKSARKIPLKASTLTDAKEEMGKRRTEAREGALPKGGVKPSVADYVRDYLGYSARHSRSDFASENLPRVRYRCSS